MKIFYFLDEVVNEEQHEAIEAMITALKRGYSKEHSAYQAPTSLSIAYKAALNKAGIIC